MYPTNACIIIIKKIRKQKADKDRCQLVINTRTWHSSAERTTKKEKETQRADRQTRVTII
jgi:hypothetical protein